MNNKEMLKELLKEITKNNVPSACSFSCRIATQRNVCPFAKECDSGYSDMVEFRKWRFEKATQMLNEIKNGVQLEFEF